MSIAGAVILLVLTVGLLNEYVLKPRYVLASVGGTDIRRRDYWKVRSVDLIQQASQYQQFSSFVEGEQQTQYLQLASQALQDLENVWGSTDVDETTLGRMIDDQVYVQNLGELNLEVTDEDVEGYILRQFDPENAPLGTPSPTPSPIPARAAWQTQTAIAQTATAVGDAAGSPEGDTPHASPVVSTASAAEVVGTPTATAGNPPAIAPTSSSAAGSPLASAETGSPVASPAAGTPLPTPTIAPTPNPEQARATAEAGYEEYRDNVFDEAHLSEDDYERWIARPAVAREEAEAALEAQVGQSGEQVRAAHILVGTRDLAQSVYEQVTQGGADFAQVAREQSTDEGTGGNGGDLGWFTREEMVPPFAEVAFALPTGQVSEPVETDFGWHVIMVFEHEPDRPLTDEQITKLQQVRVEQWLEEQKADTRIRSELEPTPTAAAEEFEPPVDAPPAPTPTPVPEASPSAPLEALPVQGPDFGGTPTTTP